jgi:hypothetical protein
VCVLYLFLVVFLIVREQGFVVVVEVVVVEVNCQNIYLGFLALGTYVGLTKYYC